MAYESLKGEMARLGRDLRLGFATAVAWLVIVAAVGAIALVFANIWQ